MTRNRLIIAAIILAIPVAALTWWLASPLFFDDEVDEAIPEGIVIITPTVTVIQADSTETVEEPNPAPIEGMPEGITAVEIRRGSFRDADGFHQGSGEAVLFQLSNGEHLLRFENFEVTNGPDLQVYLVPRLNDGEVNIDGYTDLGQLKGNVGNQNYTISADIAIPAEASIVIWCEPFSVLFSTATLR